MSAVLIGVGGSGQHVVHAYLRLLALANVDPQSVPHICVIDADAKIAASQPGDEPLAAQISSLHRRLVSALAPANRSHFLLLRPYFQKDAESLPGRADAQLELESCPPYLCDALLTDDEGDGTHAAASDRAIDLLQGMMANAKIGALAFASKIMRSVDTDDHRAVNFGVADRTSQRRHDLFDDVKGARVAIVGSSFGGTGSGVIPALVRYLSTLGAAAPSMMRAFMTLPWFDIEAGGRSAAAAQRDGIDPKVRNSALGLRAYLDELDSGIGPANYVVSQFPAGNARRLDRGNHDQGEDPHVFNIVLAVSIQNFLQRSDGGGQVDGDPAKRKLFGMITSQPEEAQGRFDAERSSHLRLRVAPNDNRSLADIVKNAEVLALALEKGAEYIQPGRSQFSVKGSDRQVEPDALRELCRTIAVTFEKLDANKLVKRGFISRVEAAPDEIYGRLAEAMMRHAETIRRSLLWLDSHRASDANPHGIVFSPMQHLFDQRGADGGARALLPASEASLVDRWQAYGLSVRNKQHDQLLGDRSPRVSQAFSLFLNVFFATKNTPRRDLGRDLMALAESQQDAPIYDVAAQMLADAVASEVDEARSRNVEFAADAVDDAAPGGSTQVFMRGLKVDQKKEDARLCVIDKAKLDAATGDPGTPNFQSPIQEAHPLTLRQIDPYLGVAGNGQEDLGTIQALAHGHRVFVEPALRGIPNVLAPRMLQQWRLEQRRSGADPARDPFVAVPGVKLLRSSEHGLYLHAARIVEAAFWLLFTQDPRVSFKTFDKEAEDALRRSAFARLVDREMKNAGLAASGNALPRRAIVFTDTAPEQAGRVIFINDPVCGWYLAAHRAARRFLAQVMPDLPSVKYGTSALDRAWRGGADVRRPEADSFEASMLRAFHAFLVKELPKFDPGLLWTGPLVDWCNALGPLVADDGPKPQLGLSHVIEVQAQPGTAATTMWQLRTPSALSMKKSLFIKDPVYFFVGDEATAQARWAGLWPLKGMAWEHVVPPDGGEGVSPMVVRLIKESDPTASDRSMWEISSISLNLKDLGTYTERLPFGARPVPGSSEKIDNIPWAAAVWPSFEAEGWNYYLAGGFWQSGKATLEDFNLKGDAVSVTEWSIVFYGDLSDEQGGERHFGEIGRVEQRMPAKLNGIPRALELVANGRVLGSMPIRLRRPPEVGVPPRCDLALDFGTSNTCLAIKLRHDDAPDHLALLPGERLQNGQALPRLTALLGPAKAPGAKLSIAEQQFLKPRSPLFFFQSFNEEESGAARSIPSELINLKSSDIEGQSRYLEARIHVFEKEFGIAPDLVRRPAGMRQAVVTPHFTPFPPAPGGLDGRAELTQQDLAQFLGSGLHKDFKWPEPGSGDDEHYGLRAVFHEQLLIAAAATLRWMNIREVKRFVATYPGAFHKHYRETYRDHLNEIIGYVFRRSGIKLTQANGVILKSETIAALAAANPASADVSVTIDMGGGTTDVGLIVPGMASGGKPFFSYMSSIRYAGNDLLKALLESPRLRESLGTVDEADDKRLDRLRIMIRRGSEKLLKPEVAAVAEAYFAGLFEYVFSLLAAAARQPNFPAGKRIKVYLFGNGFKLTKVFIDKDASDLLARVKAEAVACGLLPPTIANGIEHVTSRADPKLALIEGAIKGSIDPTDGDESEADRLLRDVEDSGHGRVAIWYPCVTRGGTGNDDVTLGTDEQRAKIHSDQAFRTTLRLDADEAKLQRSFPITSKYWAGTDTIAAIFNNAPANVLGALGQYYLEGRTGVRSSFSAVVLPVLAKSAVSHRDDSRY